jgi:hypothetical protein
MAPKTSSLHDRLRQASGARVDEPRHVQLGGRNQGLAANSAAAFVEQPPLGQDGHFEQSCDWCHEKFLPPWQRRL